MHKIFYNLCPTYMKETFVPLSEVHQHNTRSRGYNFSVPLCRSVDNTTFYHTGIKDWNSLPQWLKEQKKPKRFKQSLKKFLIEQCRETEQNDVLFY